MYEFWVFSDLWKRFWWKIEGLTWLFHNSYSIPKWCIIPYSKDNFSENDITFIKTILSSQWPWIIRSSAENEDSQKASFAWMYESRIIYNLEDFWKHIFELKERAKLESIKRYAEIMNIHSSDTIHFIVQDYIYWDVSWVFFSDLFGKWPLIECVEGTCNTLVNAEKNATTLWYWDCMNWWIQPELLKVFWLCMEIRKQFQYEIDIEWTIKDSNIYFLQLRPIIISKL